MSIDKPVDRAVCIRGENACPPEDVGGAPGYEDFLEALSDPDNPEHEDLKAGIGGSFDPAAFDMAEVNERLSSSEIVDHSKQSNVKRALNRAHNFTGRKQPRSRAYL